MKSGPRYTMPSFIVSGKKLEEAEAKIHELELKLTASEKENSILKEQNEKLTADNAELKQKMDNVLVSVGKEDVSKAKDELMGKAKGAVGDYLKNLTK